MAISRITDEFNTPSSQDSRFETDDRINDLSETLLADWDEDEFDDELDYVFEDEDEDEYTDDSEDWNGEEDEYIDDGSEDFSDFVENGGQNAPVFAHLPNSSEFFGPLVKKTDAYRGLMTGRFSYPFECVYAISEIEEFLKLELRPELVFCTIICIVKLETEGRRYGRDDVYAVVLRGLNNELIADHSFHEVCRNAVNATINFLERIGLIMELNGMILFYKDIDFKFLNRTI